MRTTPFPKYLSALGTEPNSSIEVKVIKPAKRLSARERANPYLNKAGPTVEIYDQPIITKNILTQLCTTADALVETWTFHFGEVQKNDLERVANDRAEIKGLPTSEMMEFAEMIKGGETAYSWFTGDEPMPLYDFDCRACDRFDTLRALSLFVDEVSALTSETAFEVDYLRREAAVLEKDVDDDVDEVIIQRRKLRRESFEQNFVTGDDVAKGRAARDAALSFLKDFCDTWVPKLVKGDERSLVGKESFRAKPGMKEVRHEDAGVDADAVFEALWEYQDEAAYKIVGGELVFPRLMGERLREIRAAVAAESKKTVLEMVAPELRQARLKYTDYTEDDDDGLGTYARFKQAADVEGERENYSHKDIVAEMGYGG